ncbi:MAG: DUF2780 domain-containing protein [Sulfurimonadaceae bacterium]|jgi:hypothetical protein|nr:DUF2780 domain-containing protein [Sulfurimonadaceae bacterium]
MKLTKLSLVAMLCTLNLSAFDIGGALNKAAEVANATQNTKKSDTSSLLGTLSDSLGITQTQAMGGTAALLNQAKGSMSADEFSSMTSSVPGLDDIMSSASGVSSLLGGGKSGDLASQFSSLGMDSSMVSQFAPIVVDYIKPYVSSDIATALISSLL